MVDPDPPTVYADIGLPILRFDWKAIKGYDCPLYTVRWKKEDAVEWQEYKANHKRYELNLEENSLSFEVAYEIQIAANFEAEKFVQSKFSQGCTFTLSELFGKL